MSLQPKKFEHEVEERKKVTKEEIDHRTIKLIVGIIAISLAGLTSIFAKNSISSISAAYYEGGWSQSILIGFLFAIAAFLLAYNGMSAREMYLSKLASCAALGVALFPCECNGHPALVPYIHGASAAIMFLILTFFCYEFRKRARKKGYPQAKARSAIYALCGTAIFLSIMILGVDHLLNRAISDRVPRLVFYGETVGLLAFGISWLTASRTIPVITDPAERFSPLRKENPS
jgi:hypothetical protein